MTTKIKNATRILQKALRLFIKNDPLRMAGATAYFTMFALPPILIIIVQVFGVLLGPRPVKRGLFVNLSGIFGEEPTRQIVSIIKAFRKIPYNIPATIFGAIFLLFVATTVFKVITNCINQLWSIEPQPGKRFINTLRFRLQSLLIIIIAGILFSIGILLDASQVFIGNQFAQTISYLPGILSHVLEFIISTLLVAAWFVIVFRYLPDGRPKWKVSIVGALFTSVLFSIGRIVLHLLLTQQNINSVYGASASIVLLLLFLFYTAMILYYGAAFTLVYSHSIKQPIERRRVRG